jgi:hypothetical protein
MQISSISRALLLGAAFAISAGGAQAADFTFTGNLTNNTDRVNIAFDLGSPSDVRLWTDSWNSGQNFDPISALWVQAGNDYTLVQEVDDDSSVAPGQGSYDTGLSIAGLVAGHYLYTVGASFLTPFASGTLLSQGFTQDGTPPTPIALWNQPGYDINNNDQKGTLYSILLSGVDSASVSAVPEPESVAMLLAGLGLLAAATRRKSNADMDRGDSA